MLLDAQLVDTYLPFNAKTGRPEPVWWRRAVLPEWMSYEPGNVILPKVINAFGGAVTPAGIMRVDHHSCRSDDGLGNPMLANKVVFAESSPSSAALADWTVQIQDMGDKTSFMNRPIHIRNFAGTAQLPARLSEPFLFPKQHLLQTNLAKLSGGAVSTRLFFCGMRFYVWSPHFAGYPADYTKIKAVVNKLLERRKYVFPYWLTTEDDIVLAPTPPPPPVIPPATQESDVIISDEGHLEVTHIVAVSAGNLGSNGNFGLELLNPETKQSYMNGMITKNNGIGTAQNPAELPVPLLLPSGTRLRFRFTNLDVPGIVPNTVRIALRGRRYRCPLKDWSDVSKALELSKSEKAIVGAQ